MTITSSELDIIIQKYEKALQDLKNSVEKGKSSEQNYLAEVLEVLILRHTIQISINQKLPISSNNLQNIQKIDKNLRELAKVLNLDEQLAEWRAILHGPAEHWWAIFDVSRPSPWWERFDSICSLGSLVCLGITAAFAKDIFTRFWGGGSDFQDTLSILVQSFFALIAGGTLTKPGQELLENTFKALRGFRKYWHEFSFVCSFLLMIYVISFQNSLPELAKKYNSEGLQQYTTAKQYMSAEENYNLALRLSPDYPEAHYNLAQIYEDLQDNRAMSEYQRAVRGGYYKAFYRLARLNILEGTKDKENYSKAIALLTDGSSKLRENKVLSEADIQETEYYARTYIGWARLGQKRYAEAKTRLEEASELHKKITDPLKKANPDLPKALHHCLLAQVLTEQKDSQSSQEWSECIAKGNQKIPDEDMWIGLARQSFGQNGENPKNEKNQKNGEK